MKILVKITKEILEKSMYCPLIKTCNFLEFESIKTNCAFSVAWREIFPDALVWQGITQLTPYAEDGGYLSHPQEVIDYIKLFDNCLTFEERLKIPEASFEFEIPDEAIEAIGINQVNEILSNSPNLERV